MIYSLPYLLQCKRTTWKILGRALYRWEKASIEVVMMNNLPSFCNSTWKDADFSCALWPLHKKKSCSNTEFPSSSGGSKPVWAHRKHRASDCSFIFAAWANYYLLLPFHTSSFSGRKNCIQMSHWRTWDMSLCKRWRTRLLKAMKMLTGKYYWIFLFICLKIQNPELSSLYKDKQFK